MSFFISNPLGRILNKFSSDLGQVDEQLPITLFDCLQFLMLCVGAVVVVMWAVPYVIILVLPLTILMLYVRWYFVQSSRDLKRLEATSKSPVFVAFAANMA